MKYARVEELKRICAGKEIQFHSNKNKSHFFSIKNNTLHSILLEYTKVTHQYQSYDRYNLQLIVIERYFRRYLLNTQPNMSNPNDTRKPKKVDAEIYIDFFLQKIIYL